VSWLVALHCIVVGRWSLIGQLSPSHTRPVGDWWPLKTVR